ncbi:MAG TPA: chemotaxis protein CheW [Gemmatimonadales bacterium]|nr:chemotaxis protein CheW [Gemmatimonadales bacterium]
MTSQDETFQVVVFRVGGHEFAFNIYQVQRILRYERPAALPKAPPFLEGVLQIEGGVVPVIDLRKRFELPHAPLGPDTRIMVVEAGGSAVGAVVDAVTEVLRVPSGAVTPPPPVVRGLAAAYIQGIVAQPSRTVVLLQAGKLLTSAERIALQELGAEKAHG